jgi:hypothetical protein
MMCQTTANFIAQKMGSGVSFSGKEKPDQKGHRAFLAGRVKNMIVGEKLNWSVFLSLYLPLRKTLPRVIYIIKPKINPFHIGRSPRRTLKVYQ